MNKIDIVLNSIARKHLRVEVALPVERLGKSESSYNSRLHAALLCAFMNGVRHADSLHKNAHRLLIEEVDIDLNEVSCSRTPEKTVV